MTFWSNVGWVRVLLAGIATGVAAQLLFFVLTFFIIDPTFGIGAQGVGERVETWLLPALTVLLTLLAAAWAARGAETAGMAGLLVGLLVAIVGLAFYGWFGPAAPALFVLTLAAGFLGGRLGGADTRRGA